MSELVINQSVWSDTGSPVRESVALENPGGFVVNIQSTGEEPMALGRCACRNAGAAAEGDVPPRPDPNYGSLPGLFGSTPCGTGRQYDDVDEEENNRRQRKLRQDLGLDTDENPERARSKTRQEVDYGVGPLPGFPLRSRLSDTD